VTRLSKSETVYIVTVYRDFHTFDFRLGTS